MEQHKGIDEMFCYTLDTVQRPHYTHHIFTLSMVAVAGFSSKYRTPHSMLPVSRPMTCYITTWTSTFNTHRKDCDMSLVSLERT